MINYDLARLAGGQVTLLDRARPDRPSNWITDVATPIRDAVRAGVPVVYVECGEPGRGYDNIRDVVGDTALLAVVDDSDHVLMVPSAAGPSAGEDQPSRLVAYGIRTLQNAARATWTHEHAHGAAAVVLDRIEHARPFAGIDSDIRTAYSLAHRVLDLSPRQVQQWRAATLATFASIRPTRPTLVVTKNRELPYNLGASHYV